MGLARDFQLSPNVKMVVSCFKIANFQPAALSSPVWPSHFPRQPQRSMGLTGLEPVTLRLSSACSNQLSYRPDLESKMQVGGAEESRTPDL